MCCAVSGSTQTVCMFVHEKLNWDLAEFICTQRLSLISSHQGNVKTGLEMNTRNNKKKGTQRKLRSAGRQMTNRTLPVFGFIQPRTISCFKYSDVITSSTVTSGAGAHYVFRLNNIYDPDLTGTGHQPYGFDVMALIYNRYRVNSVRWEVTFCSVADQLTYLVAPYNNTAPNITTAAEFSASAEYPRAVVKKTGYAGSPNAIFRGEIALHTLAGKTRQQYISDDIYASDYTTGPVQAMQLQIGVFNSGGVTSPFDFSIQIWYITESSDPNVISQS